jgi:hypothetical protein
MTKLIGALHDLCERGQNNWAMLALHLLDILGLKSTQIIRFIASVWNILGLKSTQVLRYSA